ncbi:M28 family peptidase [Pedobacter agri]|uniref:M28 family peptidase n=1 Tax=Pedobacter agri TaxID=454586 RepID=UPI002931C049|nr:M28 family peptidase [Pedobacter agri]
MIELVKKGRIMMDFSPAHSNIPVYGKPVSSYIRKTMKVIFLFVILTVSNLNLYAQNNQKADSLMLRSIFDNALTDKRIEPDLFYLTKNIGSRISGSENARKAIEWAKAKMEEIHPDKVYLQEVVVPHWIRGSKEASSFTTKNGKVAVMSVSALGGSIATNGLLKAQVVEVRSWAELDDLGLAGVKGKFVFFNRPMDPREIEVFKAYLAAADQRAKGAIEAAKKGAVGALVRSLTLSIDDFPHTGTMNYEAGVNKIPAAALSTKSADLLSVELKNNPALLYTLQMNCKQLPDVKSYNVIGEITGANKPEEIISMGGHIDSWDLSEGASDDGTGFVQTLEVLRLIQERGARPERTFRAILYINEEAGAHGAYEYARIAGLSGEKHIAVLESDAGGFSPRGFRIDGNPEAVAKIKSWKSLLTPYKVDDIQPDQRGIDLIPMKDISKVLISLTCDDQRFFDIHHSGLDTFDKINIREVELGAASMAAMVSLISKYGL